MQAMAADTPPFALTDAILFTGDIFVEGHAIVVEGGKILDLVPRDKVPANVESISLPHVILTPGYIDCQVNGGGNVLLNNTPSKEGVLAIAAAHRRKGTTRLLPTVITDAPEVTKAALAATREARTDDPSILGIHIEGPHIAPQAKRVHSESNIRPLLSEDLLIYRPESGETMLITLAPEQVTPEQIEQLRRQGVVVSIGHSAAEAADVRAALAAGATGFTHLFNGMSAIASRAPGPAGVALDDRESWCGMIADGHHLAPELVRLALRAKPHNRLFFVSDAQAPAGADKPEPFILNGQKVLPGEDVCRTEGGTIAGAMMTLGDMVPFAIRNYHIAPELALRMASTIPAEFLGLDKKLGRLLPGYAADILALNHSFKAEKIWRAGQKVI